MLRPVLEEDEPNDSSMVHDVHPDHHHDPGSKQDHELQPEHESHKDSELQLQLQLQLQLRQQQQQQQQEEDLRHPPRQRSSLPSSPSSQGSNINLPAAHPVHHVRPTRHLESPEPEEDSDTMTTQEAETTSVAAPAAPAAHQEEQQQQQQQQQQSRPQSQLDPQAQPEQHHQQHQEHPRMQQYDRPTYLNQIQPRHPQGLTMEEKLQMMPEKREMPWRPGIEPGSEYETGGDSRRKQIRFGCLLATRGEIAPTPCNSCANGRGKFSVCVYLEGFFKGACASCQLSGRPNRCSIKIDDDNKPENHSPSLGQTPEGGTSSTSAAPSERAVPTGMMPSPQSISQDGLPPINSITTAPETRIPALAAAISRPSSGGPLQGSLPLKRRRIDDPPGAPTPYDLDRSQWQQEFGISQARQQMALQRPWPPSGMQKSFPGPLQGQLPTHMLPNGNGGARGGPGPPGLPLGRSSPHGWQSLNHTLPPTGLGPSPGDRGRMSPLPDPRYGSRADEGDSGGDGKSMMDTISRGRQRQIYGLMSGLQGGIDLLQRELDGLKRAIGLDET